MKLSPAQENLLVGDVGRVPAAFGYCSEKWTGRLLKLHLARKYDLSYTVRHCRRLLRRLQPQVSMMPAPTAPVARGQLAWSGFSDCYRAEVVLRRISRLATAQFQVAPFVWTVFDLLAQAIDLGDSPKALIENSVSGFRWLFRDVDFASTMQAMDQAVVFSRDPKISGVNRNLHDVPRIYGPVIEPGELMSEFFHRSPAYHEFYRPLNLHFGMVGILREPGDLIGALPVWKGRGGAPFTRTEVDLLRAAIPHIAHGVQLSRLLRPASVNAVELEGFWPTPSVPGIVILDARGKVVAADERARSIFGQIGVFDGRPPDAFAAAQIRSGFEYIGRTIRAILANDTRASAVLNPPVVRVWSHATGLTIRLRGYMAQDVIGGGMWTVLVERGEPGSLLRQQFKFRFGLSEREAEVLSLVKEQMPRSAIIDRLGISMNTLKTYLRQISIKLEDCGDSLERLAHARRSRELAPNTLHS